MHKQRLMERNQSTHMREAQRRILVMSFPEPGVTNDPPLIKE
jgi:hypothetical protein